MTAYFLVLVATNLSTLELLRRVVRNNDQLRAELREVRRWTARR